MPASPWTHSPEGRAFGCWIRKSKYNTDNATGRPAWRKLGQAVGRRREASEGTRAAASKKQNSHSKAAFCSKWPSVARDFSFETEIIQREIILCELEMLPRPAPPTSRPISLSLPFGLTQVRCFCCVIRGQKGPSSYITRGRACIIVALNPHVPCLVCSLTTVE